MNDELRPDFSASVKFLRLLYPDGPWMLTAITVDKKKIDARTFENLDDVPGWLQEHSTWNLYYSVNQPIFEAREKKKLAKTDVLRVHYLHVDVDPRAGEDVAAEQERIKQQILSYRIPPSLVVFSGGGYNAIWRLEEPISIAENSPSPEETIARAIDVERRNWQFELDFQTPDHCRDISRILRLPGTLNRPNAQKIEKGRTIALAKLIEIGPPRHAYSAFMATPHVSSNAPSTKTKVSQDTERVESLDELLVPEKLKVIIAQGFDPEDPKRWEGDRSSALFYVCCALVRAGVKDSIVLGIITDSRFVISASVLDKGNGVMRYALRQIERAKDHADNEILGHMNDRFAIVLSYGGGVRAMIEKGEYDEATQRYTPIFQKMSDFKERVKSLPAIVIEGKKKSISAYEYWTSSPRRREYESVTFEPGIETPGRYNLWNGFAVEPKPGNRHDRFLDHAFRNTCCGDQERFDYLIGWMARVVQQPRSQSEVAPVLLGTRGSGKSILGKTFAKLFWPHAFVAKDDHELTGKFNIHLRTSVFLLAEEAFDLSNKRHESVLKELITSHVISVEGKGANIVQSNNYLHIMMTSNNERVVPAGDKERRFFVTQVRDFHDEAYFEKFLAEMDREGLANLLHWLMSYDLSKYNVRRVPQTSELRQQQTHNTSPEIDWLWQKLTTGVWLSDNSVKWEGPVVKEILWGDYVRAMEMQGVHRRMSQRMFGIWLKRMLPNVTDKQMSPGQRRERPWAFVFPPLEECRRRFAEDRGTPEHDWPSVEEGVVYEEQRSPFS